MSAEGADELALALDNGFTVRLIDDVCYTRGSADIVREYDRVYDLGPLDDPYVPAQIGVHVERNSAPCASCILIAHTGARMPLDPARVVRRPDRLIIAVANIVLALRLPQLDLLWQRDVDHGVCCFALHELPGEPDALISHGEMSITRLDDNDGDIRWQCGWREIFTGPFEVRGDAIRAVDFDGVALTISAKTGEILRVEQP